MNPERVVSRAEWLTARRDLLKQEKESTRQRDAVAAARRALPLVEIHKEYVFEGPGGRVSLRDLFDGRSQLIVNHFMFDPNWEEGCKSCSHMADNYAGILVHLAARDTSFAAISRAPIEKIEAFKARMGWTFPWFSSHDNSFNVDFAVTVDVEEIEGSGEYNYERAETLFKAGKIWFPKGELPGLSVFLRQDDRVFHSYSTYQRGLDIFLNTYNLLDLTPLGRQEEDGRIQAWIRHHDRYHNNGGKPAENAMTVRTLLDRYYAGLARRKGWEDVIAEDFVFTGGSPGSGTRGKAAYGEVIRRFSRMIETVAVKKTIVDGDSACATITYGVVSPSGKKAALDVTEVWTARNALLASLAIYFDTATWKAFLAD